MSNESGIDFSYNDLTAEVNIQSYYYKVIAVKDTSEIESLNIARTIYLSGDSPEWLINHLYWTPYENRTPLVYNVLQNIDTYYNSNTWGDIVYNDNVSAYMETSGGFYYTIEASLYDILPERTFSDTVYSNRILVVQEPRVYIPNAFTPDGSNPIFKPITVFMDVNEYTMDIYDRWGEKLFSTSNIEEGWNGYYNGKVCPLDSYVYRIRLRLPSDEIFEKTGSVTLLR